MGVIGIMSLSLSLRFAVGSLMHKLKSRQKPDTQPPVYKKVSVGELAIHNTTSVNFDTYNNLYCRYIW